MTARAASGTTTAGTPTRVLVFGGSGVLGRSVLPLLLAAGHQVQAPARAEIDIVDADAVRHAVHGVDAVYHLATRIPPPAQQGLPEAWGENDRLRAEATRVLVDAALAAGVETYVQPTVALIYPEGQVDEDTPIGAVSPYLESALTAEREVARFAAHGRRGVVLRLGLLDGPGTGLDQPNPAFGATLHVRDAGRALVAALTIPSGVYNVVRDGERVANTRFRRAAGWTPERREPAGKARTNVYGPELQSALLHKRSPAAFR